MLMCYMHACNSFVSPASVIL